MVTRWLGMGNSSTRRTVSMAGQGWRGVSLSRHWRRAIGDRLWRRQVWVTKGKLTGLVGGERRASSTTALFLASDGHDLRNQPRGQKCGHVKQGDDDQAPQARRNPNRPSVASNRIRQDERHPRRERRQTQKPAERIARNEHTTDCCRARPPCKRQRRRSVFVPNAEFLPTPKTETVTRPSG